MSSLDKTLEQWLTFGLALVGGYADATGFVLARSFTGHITGNLVLVAVSAVALQWRLTLARLAAVVAFLAGVVLSLLLARLLAAYRSSTVLAVAMALEMLLIIGAYLALAGEVRAGTEIFVVCLAGALGLQNGAFRRAVGINVHTTYITGMITSLMVAVDARLRAAGDRWPPDPTIWLRAAVWALFVIGAVIGAATVYRFREGGLAGLLLILLALLIGGSCMAARERSQEPVPE